MRGAPQAARHPSGLERARGLALLALAVWAVLAARAAFADFVFEDSYITYRYARNLAAGQGFVFNPGERVLGTSTPLWTLLLAGVARLTGAAVPAVAGWLFPLAWAGAALLGAALLCSRGRGNLGALFVLSMVWGAGGVLLVWGMESALYLALLLAALAAALARRELATGVLLGLAMITRFDAVLFAGLLLLLVAVSGRRIPWRAGLAACALVVPWLVFSTLYFGAPFPNTLSAKAGDEAFLDYLRGALSQGALAFATPLLRFVPPPLPRGAGLLLAASLLPLPFLARRAVRGRPELWVLGLFPLALWFSYALIGPPVEHTWHMLPAVLLAFLFGLLAWGELLGARERSRAVTAALLVLIALSLWQLGPRTRRAAEAFTSLAEYGRRVLVKEELAGVIRALGLEDASLCAGEVGYLGYASGCRMIDSTGLITPGVRGHGPPAERTSLEELAAEHDPDLFVMPTQGWPGLSGYRALHTSVHLKSLYAREALFEQHAEALAAAFLAPAAPAVPGAPHRWTAPGTGGGAGWWSSSDRRPFVKPRSGIPSGPGGGELFTRGPVAKVLTGPEFLIDFDELRLELLLPGGADTRAELLVRGQVVLREDGSGGPDGAAPGAWRSVRWPLRSLRGLPARLRLVDHARGADLRARNLAALDWERGAPSGVFGEPSGFPPAPDAEALVAHVGPQLLRPGGVLASSSGAPGEHLLRVPVTPGAAGPGTLLVELSNDSGAPCRVELELEDGTLLHRELPPSTAGRVLAFDLPAARAELRVLDADPGPGGVTVLELAWRPG